MCWLGSIEDKMIQKSALYNSLADKDRRSRLANLSVRQAIQQLEELLSLYDFFVPKKMNRPLPLSLSRLLDPKFRRKLKHSLT